MTADELARMNADDIRDAVAELIADCKQDELDRDFTPVTVRRHLRHIGYGDRAMQDAIIRAIAANGFTYCLDPIIPTGDGEFPCWQVCAWSPDQMRSRLPDPRFMKIPATD